MKSIHAAIVLVSGLIVACWWAAILPSVAPKTGASVATGTELQCPAGSQREGKRCICPSGMVWTGDACAQVWSSSSPRVGERVASITPDSSLRYARGQVPALPYNLNTWPNKVKAINSSVPVPGSVAMIKLPSGPRWRAGHVAIVEAVGENSLTIIEGNYELGSVTRRTATGKDLDDAARQLGIVGYYKP